ncbi:glycerate kinase [Dunckerocampus dactyliophorus]|uniref:glycerate kinase n=1 Tax=Dunckerocampus dactyliophorus TaxID=161453 RepID=UPI002406B91A|nr:glycerate kinase [Dunckerocampus dactyliophorus]XP_054641420.1 glycerate kinase [Dunckerocampus dactyliophorus]XP_054641421.1 glycerate kinase [Dunckerocampus dactyliophorus]XP_054641422.1 glycerate kinase [Dunckerocampus dactyliophorus]XP_054641424.1 glycerate kinase [Dunckerocampus dactyliophorus]
MARLLSLCRPPVFVALLGRRNMSLDYGAREVFMAAVEAVQPDVVVRYGLQRKNDSVIIGGRKFLLQNNVHVVGFGKAVLGMATEAERIVGDHLVGGVISVPHGIQQTLRQHGKEHLLLKESSRIRVMEGAQHNLPDSDSMKAAECIAQLTSTLTDKDLLFVLISGGGSALLPAPIPPITLQEKLDVTRKLAAAGATIQELNTVRRALSVLKGGGLAKRAHPAQVVALILSDVIGDPLDLIASGPTVGGQVWREDVLAVLERYKLLDSAPAAVKDVLGRLRPRQEVEKDETGHVLNAVIGSNSIALQRAGHRAQELGFNPVVLSPGVCGDVRSVSHLYGLLARFACSHEDPPSEITAKVLKLGPEVGVESADLRRTMQSLEQARSQGGGTTCVLAGGEPTVELTGKGQGGRNQELVMRVALELRGLPLPPHGPVFLSGGTDGQDGPTEAAGAVTDGGLHEEAQRQGLDISSFLHNNDSFNFFKRLSGGHNLLVPGLTCTNVMDVHVLIIPQSKTQ